MNVFLLTDLEGVWNVASVDCVDTKTDAYKFACKELVREVNFIGSILKNSGADNIYCLDGHGGDSIKNIDSDKMFPYIKLVDGNTWQELVRNKMIDIQMEIGSHARAGTVNGFLDHTLNSQQYYSVLINNREFSELALHSAFLGAYGIPVVFTTGDITSCEQAKEYVKDIVTAPVKKRVKETHAFALRTRKK